MTGGGFGGCTINLVAENRPSISTTRWQQPTGHGITPEIYVCHASNAVSEVTAVCAGGSLHLGEGRGEGLVNQAGIPNGL
jgi:hypothetical protein